MESSSTTSRNRKLVTLTVSKDSMLASVLLREPTENDAEISVQDIMDAIAEAGVTYGIDSEFIEKVVSDKAYNAPHKVASGAKPQRGESAKFKYHFDTSGDHKPKETEDGHIDYKDINFIQSTEAGTILVSKTSPAPGKPGTNVFGKQFPGPEGKDIPFKNGANTKVSDDGLELIATSSGAIQSVHNKVSVANVIPIKGDVDHTIGNINTKGSVRVSGDVKAGFSINIDGDLEVSGNVEDCDITVQGNIYVKGGAFGKGDGVMHADGDIHVKYAEGQRMTSDSEIHVGCEIINCDVQAKEKVLVKGRHGKIVGGDVKAGKSISACVLGSEAGTATALTVAYSPELMTKLKEIDQEVERLHEDNERIQEGLYALIDLQMQGKLTPDKEEAMAKLKQFQKELPGNLENLSHQKEQILAKLEEFRDAEIVAEEKIYPGVKTCFGVVYHEFTDEQKGCRLTREDNRVKIP